MLETTERPVASVHVKWNPNNGQLDINLAEMSRMECVAVLEFAVHTLLSVKNESAILPAGRILPNLIKQ